MNHYNSKILGTGASLPKKVLSNFDLEKMLDTSDEWITERTGIKERRIANPAEGEALTDLAKNAAEQALKTSGLSPNDIDMILFATLTGDLPLPNSACILQNKLGITNNCACLDIDAACSGFVYALTLANSLIQTGMMKNILVCGGEILSHLVDWQDRGSCILFGDGCGAALLGRAPEGDTSSILSAHLGAEGAGVETLFIKAGGSKFPISKEVIDAREHYIQMKGKEIFKMATRTMADNAKIVMEKAGIGQDKIDWFIPHQANIRIIETTAKLLGFDPQKVIMTIEKYGNNSSATIPIAFHEAVTDGRIKRGQTVLLDAFGAGLTTAAALIRY